MVKALVERGGHYEAIWSRFNNHNAILAARDVVSMFCYPEPATMDKPRACRLTYNARHDFYAAALDCLAAAHAALEAGYKLNHLHRRG